MKHIYKIAVSHVTVYKCQINNL